MRGATVSGLPAAVREINESYTYDKNTPEFFMVCASKGGYSKAVMMLQCRAARFVIKFGYSSEVSTFIRICVYTHVLVC